MQAGARSVLGAVFAAAVVALTAGGCSTEADDAASGTEDVTAAKCADYVGPSESATCTGCPDGQSCQSNGCFGGYWCHETANKCVSKPPTGCPTSDMPVIVSSFETPTAAGLQPVIDAIVGARTSIRMTMFHLTVKPVVDALAAAAKRGVDVQIIIDQGNWNGHTTQATKGELSTAGVKVIPSSTGFRITHVKSFVVDQETAYIMSLNLTSPFVDTRDYAVVTKDKGVVDEFLLVWNADVANAKNGTADTPALTNPNLAWSPVSSRDRLAAFVGSARKTLVVSTENLGDPTIQQALIAAAARKVDVRVIAPECDQNADVTFDLPYLGALAAGHVTARAMPLPAGGVATPAQPYIHAKMMIADGERAYVGSINLSTGSTTSARELGIFFDDAKTIQMMSAAFEHDWAEGVAPPKASAANCPTAATADVALGEVDP